MTVKQELLYEGKAKKSIRPLTSIFYMSNIKTQLQHLTAKRKPKSKAKAD